MVLFIVPLGMMFVVSLGTRDPLDRVVLDTLSFDNYARAFDPVFLPTFLNSLRYAAATTVLSLVIGYPIAYWISRYGGRHKALLLILVMLPFWTSYLIRTYAWMIILRDNGVLNSILQAVGLTSEPIILLNTDFSVVLGMTYGFLPFAILPLYVSIDRLDPALTRPRATCTPTGGRPSSMSRCRSRCRGSSPPRSSRSSRRSATTSPRTCSAGADHDDRQGRPGPVPRRTRLAVRLGPRLPADGHHARRHLLRRSVAARGRRDMRPMR